MLLAVLGAANTHQRNFPVFLTAVLAVSVLTVAIYVATGRPRSLLARDGLADRLTLDGGPHVVPGRLRRVPDVEIVGEEVGIGELGNLAVLKKAEWNLLVDLIESGQFKKV